MPKIFPFIEEQFTPVYCSLCSQSEASPMIRLESRLRDVWDGKPDYNYICFNCCDREESEIVTIEANNKIARCSKCKNHSKHDALFHDSEDQTFYFHDMCARSIDCDEQGYYFLS